MLFARKFYCGSGRCFFRHFIVKIWLGIRIIIYVRIRIVPEATDFMKKPEIGGDQHIKIASEGCIKKLVSLFL